MPDFASFLLAGLALLATPGPTNTLLAASGATRGIRASLPLVPAELAGYLIALAVLTLVLVPLADRLPILTTALRIVAALFLLWSARKLWLAGRALSRGSPVTPARVFFTTLLNPKALVFAVVLFPGRDPAWAVPLFSALVSGVAVAWILAGHALGRLGRSAAVPGRVNRLTAVGLGLFAVLVAGSALGGP